MTALTVPKDKWVVVTGAQRGLGLEAAKILAKAGYKLILSGRNVTKAEEAIVAVKAAVPALEAVPVALDNGDPASIAAAAAHLKAHYDQQIGAVVNNAGIIDFGGWTQKGWDNQQNINVWGVIAITEQFLPILAEGGRIVEVSSLLAKTRIDGFASASFADTIEALTTLDSVKAVKFDPEDAEAAALAAADAANPTAFKYPTYRISKALLNRAVIALAKEERFTKRGVAVVAVDPGWCRTDLGSQHAPDSAQLGGARIAWAVQHPNAAALSGGFWTAQPVAGQPDETVVEGVRTSLFDWQPVAAAA